MGNWNITIQGSGAHHQHPSDAVDYDANKMAADFVARLKAAGHSVTSATFTHGAVDSVIDGAEYLERNKRIEDTYRANHPAPVTK